MTRHPLHTRAAGRRSRGFTLVEIMIVVGILAIILAIAAPTWMRQRLLAQQRSCQQNLFQIQGAKEQWALDLRQSDTATPGWSDLTEADGSGYMKAQPICPAGGSYQINSVANVPTCDIVGMLPHKLP